MRIGDASKFYNNLEAENRLQIEESFSRFFNSIAHNKLQGFFHFSKDDQIPTLQKVFGSNINGHNFTALASQLGTNFNTLALMFGLGLQAAQYTIANMKNSAPPNSAREQDINVITQEKSTPIVENIEVD